jgi:hypothetical protein
VHWRNDCRLAVQVLTRGHPANKRDWALGVLPECAASGPPMFVRLWSQMDADHAALEEIAGRMGALRDQRMFDAVATSALDDAAPATKRAAALGLLLRWARPGVSVMFAQFFTPEALNADPEAIWFPMRMVVSHDEQRVGARPLEADVRLRVLAIANQVLAGATERPIKLISAEVVAALTQ